MNTKLRDAVKNAAKDYYDSVKLKSCEERYVPVSGKVIEFEELSNMIDASLDMWLTSGRFNDEFEEKFAKYLKAKFALTVNSGSSANLLAITALMSPKLKEKALKKGDEVITAAVCFPTTVGPIVQNGLIPIFLDCELTTYNIDTWQIENAITSKTRAIVIAHTLGNPFSLEEITKICKKYDLWLVEDSCDALGAEYAGKKVGTIGHIGTFSFYPAHHITMGEGGAVVTNDPLLYRIMLSIRDWGRDCWCKPGKDDTCGRRFSMQYGNLPFGYDHKYVYFHLGYNLKITDWQAAIGLAQLKKLDQFIEQRTKNSAFLLKKLADLQKYLILPSQNSNSVSSWFGFPISVKPTSAFKKIELVKYLESNGIGTRQVFAGNVLRHPLFTETDICLRIGNSEILSSSKLSEEDHSRLPNSEFVMNNTFWVGCFHGLEESELNRTSNVIHMFFEKFK
jgi:CDP-6-deoxy-D-xylo-4-hexulose-3-dehydrase